MLEKYRESQQRQRKDEELAKLKIMHKMKKDLVNDTFYHCDAECDKLQALFKYHWPRNKPKAVIYYLSRVEGIPNLRKAIKLMGFKL